MATRVKQDETPSKPKYRYRVMNWAEYDLALVNRGNLTVWFDAETIKGAWTPVPPEGRGKPWLYSDVAIQTCLTVKTLFRLPYNSQRHSDPVAACHREGQPPRPMRDSPAPEKPSAWPNSRIDELLPIRKGTPDEHRESGAVGRLPEKISLYHKVS